MTTARVLYRDYLIDLELTDKGWRAVFATHSTNGKMLLPKFHFFRDQATAERHAKTVIDAELAGNRRPG